MRRKRLWLLVSAVIILAILLTACKTKETTTTTAATTTAATTTATTIATTTTTATTTTITTAGMPKYGGTLTFALSADLSSYDSWSTNPQAFALMIYDPLMNGNILLTPEEWPYYGEYKPLKALTGCLVESWELPEIGTAILHVRQGVNFQNIPPVNGREMTADDLVYSVNRAISPLSSVATSQSLRDYVISVTALDKYTVEYKYNPAKTFQGWFELLYRSSWVVSKEVVDKYGGSLANPIGQVGTGPYIIKDRVPGSSFTCIRNPDYWDTDPRYAGNKLPYTNTVIMTVIPDLSTRIAALRTGKITLLTGVSWDQADSITQTSPELIKRKILSEVDIYISPRDDILPFSDVRVRRALSMSIDRHAIVDQYYNGDASYSYYYVPAHWPEHIPLDQFSQEIQDIYNYNPDKAKQLMIDAGYPNGFNTEIQISATNTAGIELMQVLKNWWFENLNVNVEIKVLDAAAHASQRQKHTFPGMQYGGGGLALPNAGFSYIYQPKGTFRIYNCGEYFDQRYIDLYDAFLASYNLPQAERDILWRDMVTFVREQTPVINLPSPNSYKFWQPWLKGYWGQANWSTSGGSGELYKYMWIDKG